jgi:DivIVA domain-containing protein
MAEPIGPEDIENVTFPTSLRGYDRDSVDIFLQEVASAYEAATNELNAARAQKPYRSLGEEMGDLLQHAKDSAEETKRTAESEARVVLDQANQTAGEKLAGVEAEAVRIRQDAEQDATQKIQEAAETVAQLEKMESEARAELRTLRMRLESVVGQLASLEREDVPTPPLVEESLAPEDPPPYKGPVSEEDSGPTLESPPTEPISLVPEGAGFSDGSPRLNDDTEL